MAAEKKSSDRAELDRILADLDEIADGLSGHSAVSHHLDVALVHALAGARDDALAALHRAEEEIGRFEPALRHLAGDYAIAKARVHAVLSRG